MASSCETGFDYGETRLRDDDVKKNVGFRFGENRSKIGADDRAGEGEFLGKRAGRALVQVYQTRDPDFAGDFRRGLDGAQPAFGHSSAPA